MPRYSCEGRYASTPRESSSRQSSVVPKSGVSATLVQFYVEFYCLSVCRAASIVTMCTNGREFAISIAARKEMGRTHSV